MGILGALGLLFVGLKLTGFITWSWWWVTLPFWGVLALLVISFGIALGFSLTLDAIEQRNNKKHKTPWSK